MDINNFEIFYRGKYNDEEQKAWDRLQKSLSEPAPAAGPGPFGPRGPQVIKDYEMKTFNSIWSPFNPYFTDEAYAAKTKVGQITAFPCFVEPMGRTPMVPQEMGQTLMPLIKTGFNIPGGLFDNEIQFLKPITAGMELTSRQGPSEMVDITNDGDPFRVFRGQGITELVDQTGDVVARGVMGGTSGVVRFKDPDKAPDIPALLAQLMGTDGNGLEKNHFSIRRGPAHVYTEDDYDFIRDLWAKEKVRGAETLYWDDVNVGDEPAWTCDGPITDIDLIRYHGSTAQGNIGIRDRIIKKDFNGLVKDRYNMYYMDWALHLSSLNIPGGRPYHFNTTVRNQILRMVTNWCGDDGFVSSISWRLGDEPASEEDYWNRWPEGFARESWLLKVPYLKAAGRFMDHHAMAGDLSICKGYVYNKYEENGEYFVEMACWAETIEGYITSECRAVVKLPKR